MSKSEYSDLGHSLYGILLQSVKRMYPMYPVIMFVVCDATHFSWGASTPKTLAPKGEESRFVNDAVWIKGPLTFNPRQITSNQAQDYNDPLQVNHNKQV